MKKLQTLLSEILESRGMTKIVFSKSRDKTVKRSEGRIIELRFNRVLQIETFYKNGKTEHKNIAEEQAEKELTALSALFGQINIFTTDGDCEILISSKGTSRIINRIGKNLTPAAVGSNDRERHYILDPKHSASFLSKLGVCTEAGEIFDKKRSKFRQINRFVEILDDVYPFLPQDGELTVCDLCCGKSYLTFAVYHYLTKIKKREVRMYGVDLKSDVIAFCQKTANELGFDRMEFFCADISEFDIPTSPHLVVSLHACDIATDMVLYTAARLGAKIILSTPCCQHEMANQMNCERLRFVSEQSILHRKMCDALTDALRCKRLEAEGYKVTAIELIDPEETPKNIMIKAIKSGISAEKREKALAEYRSAVEFLNVQPYLDRLFSSENFECAPLFQTVKK